MKLAAAVFLIALLAGSAFVPFDPLAAVVAERLQPPSLHHWFGTDAIGRDVFSRVLAAGRVDLALAAAAVAVSGILGTVTGAVAGYVGGGWDRVLARVVDGLMAFPLFVVALLLAAVLGNGLGSVVIATAVINLPFYIRLARIEVSSRRNADYVQAARLGGAGEAAVIFRVLLPNALPTVAVQVSVNLGWAVLNTAALSFIGLGVRAPMPEWGVEIAEGAHSLMSGQWWLAFWPGLMLVLAVLATAVLGDGVRDWLDPLSRFGGRR